MYTQRETNIKDTVRINRVLASNQYFHICNKCQHSHIIYRWIADKHSLKLMQKLFYNFKIQMEIVIKIKKSGYIQVPRHGFGVIC
jgi:hypothetical protein